MLKCLQKAALACLSSCALLLAAAAQALPPGFAETQIGGTWNEVGGLAFSSDGTRLYVVERGGKVWIVENGVKLATPFLDISDEVGAWRDFGMLGFALHPNFEQNGYVYALYVVDRYYLFNHGTPEYNPALLETQQFQATIGRVSRFTADPATGRRTILAGSQVILVGETPDDGFPILHQSHGTGQVVFGQDGTLLVSAGDGASYDVTDTGSDVNTYYVQALQDGIIRPWENVGAWRSQQVDSLNGKILRIDPYTGLGLSTNPFYDAAAPRSTRSRVWALGLRNPYRFTLRPLSGEHDPGLGDPGTFYIGDVGWNSAEELDTMPAPRQNFGWPAFEGLNQRGLSTPDISTTYWNAGTPNPKAKNPLGSEPGCSVPFLRFRDLIVQESENPPSWPNPCNPAVQIPDSWTDPSDGTVYVYDKFVHSRPPLSWRGNAWVATFDASGNADFEQMGTPQSPVSGPDFSGNTSTAGVWYTGTDFPVEWQNRYYHGDYGSGWIKAITFDANDQPVDVDNFVDPGNSVTFVTTNPVTGGIYYVNWGDTVSEVRWVGTGNTPPTAVAEPPVAWSTGPQLSVQFSASASSDPDPGAVLSYLWNFGDGDTSTQRDPLHVFDAVGPNPQVFLVTLTVTDEDNNSDVAQARVFLENSPPSVQLTSPADGGLYNMLAPTVVSVASNVSDAEHATPSLSCALLVELVHNTHAHQEPLINACSANVTITPAGCDGNTYSWRFTLTVTDPLGLAATDSVSLYPDCSTLPNTPPFAQPDGAAVLPGGSVPIDVLDNDSDSDGSLVPSSVVIVSPPSSGSLQVNPVNGVITYTHDGTGTSDSFTYTVEDDDGAPSNPALVSLTVISPIGLVAAWGFEESAGGSVTDSSGSNNTGTLNGVTRIPEGYFGKGLSFNGVNSVVEIPDASSLDLTTEMTVEAWVYPTSPLSSWKAILQKEVDAYFLNANTSANRVGVGGTLGGSCCAVLEGPTGLPVNQWTHVAGTYDGTALRLYLNGTQVATQPASGNLQENNLPLRIGGNTYGDEFFPGRIDEVRVYSRALSAVEIQGDMIMPIVPSNAPPVAAADAATLAEGGSAPIDLAANDTDPEGALDLASIQVASGPANGSVAVHPDGTVTYTHDGSETAADSFSYTIRDAFAASSNAATVTLTLTPVNDAPLAVADGAALAEGASVPIDLAANDTDAEAALDLASIQVTSGPSNGSVAVHPDGTVTYTHDGSETTSDSFTYTIRDAAAAPSNAATVSINVSASNDAPLAVGDGAATAEGGSVPIDLAANDSDAEGALDLASIQVASGPASGSVDVHPDGTVTYTHDGSETAADSFTYTIRDAAAAPSNAATVSIGVSPVNDAPLAVGDGAVVAEGGGVVIGLSANDSDAEGALDLASIQVASGPANGSVEIHPDGSVTYTHDGSETTSDSFTYTIRDAAAAPSNAATVSLSVSASNDAPVAVGDGASVLFSGSVLIALAANDTDADNALDLASIQITVGPANGSVQIHPDGTVTYTHDGSQTASDSFSYTIRDAAAAESNAATVSLSITPPPEVPAVNALGVVALAAGLLATGRANLSRRRRRG